MADVYLSDDALLRDYAKLNQEYKNKAGRYIKNLLKIQRAESKVEREIKALPGEAGDNFGRWQEIRCNFCGKRSEDVTRMISGPGVYICDECVDLCSEIFAEYGEHDEEETEQTEVGKAEE